MMDNSANCILSARADFTSGTDVDYDKWDVMSGYTEWEEFPLPSWLHGVLSARIEGTDMVRVSFGANKIAALPPDPFNMHYNPTIVIFDSVPSHLDSKFYASHMVGRAASANAQGWFFPFSLVNDGAEFSMSTLSRPDIPGALSAATTFGWEELMPLLEMQAPAGGYASFECEGTYTRLKP
jgi:hypothetical protein